VDPDLAAVARILRELDVYIGHYQSDGSAFVSIYGSATVGADDAHTLERVLAA